MIFHENFSNGLNARKVRSLNTIAPMALANRVYIVYVVVNKTIQPTEVNSHMHRNFSNVDAGNVR